MLVNVQFRASLVTETNEEAKQLQLAHLTLGTGVDHLLFKRGEADIKRLLESFGGQLFVELQKYFAFNEPPKLPNAANADILCLRQLLNLMEIGKIKGTSKILRNTDGSSQILFDLQPRKE